MRYKRDSGGGGGGGITSINGNSNPAQLLNSGAGITIDSLSVPGTTTISATGGGGNVTGAGIAPYVAYWDAGGFLSGDSNFTWDAPNRAFAVGDANNLNNGTSLTVNDTGQAIFLSSALTEFYGPAQSVLLGRVQGGGGVRTVVFGDVSTTNNNTLFTIDDVVQSIVGRAATHQFWNDVQTSLWGSISPATSIVEFGDISGNANGTTLRLDDVTQSITGNAITAGTGSTLSAVLGGISTTWATGGVMWGFAANNVGGGQTHIFSNNIDFLWPNVDSTGTQALVSDGAGNLSWASMSTGGMVYGGPSGGGNPDEVLYIDGSGNVASDATFKRAPANFVVQTLNGANTAELQIDANTPFGNITVSDGTVTSIFGLDPLAGSSISQSSSTPGVGGTGIDFDTSIIEMFHDDSTGNMSGIRAAFTILQLSNSDGFGLTTDWLWPQTDGTSGNVLTTNGAGVLSWGQGGVVDTSNAIAVRVATTTVLPNTPTYANGTGGVGATLTETGVAGIGNIDGIALVLTDRVLVKNQISQIENGVYEVTDVGGGGLPYILTRTTDSDATVELDDQIVVPSAGSTQSNQVFGQTTQSPTLGTSNVVYITITSTYVTQSVTGTQVAGQIPVWTGNPRQLTRGTANFTWDLANDELNVVGHIVLKTQTGENQFIGIGIGNSTLTGTNNIGIGKNSGALLTTGSFNTLLGTEAGASLTAGGQNTFIGNEAGRYLIADNQIAIGYQALRGSAIPANNTGTDNAAFGYQAGTSITIGVGNFFVGYQAGTNTTTGDRNNFNGYQAGFTNTDGGYNSFVGYQAGYSNTTGDFNIFEGYQAGYSNVNGTENVFIGFQTGELNVDGSSNIALGTNAFHDNTAGAQNIALGVNALADNTLADNNIALGSSAGRLTTIGGGNIFIGQNAGNTNVDGTNNVILGTSSDVGTSSTSNATALGANAVAGANSVSIGQNSGSSTSTGVRNTLIGDSSSALAGTDSDAIAIGYQAVASANQFVAGSNGSAVSNVYFGNGITAPASTAGQSIIIHSSAAGGTTGDLAGGNITLAPGASTGLGTPSSVLLQTANKEATGTTPQTLSTVAKTTGTTDYMAFEIVRGLIQAVTQLPDAAYDAGTAANLRAATPIYIFEALATTGRTFTLPLLADVVWGTTITIKDGQGTAGTYNITIDGAGSEVIDGATTFVMNNAYQSVTVVANGNVGGSWWSII